MKHLFIAATLALGSLPAFAGQAQTFAFGEPAPAAKATRTVNVVLKDIAFEEPNIEEVIRSFYQRRQNAVLA